MNIQTLTHSLNVVTADNLRLKTRINIIQFENVIGELYTLAGYLNLSTDVVYEDWLDMQIADGPENFVDYLVNQIGDNPIHIDLVNYIGTMLLQ